MARVDSHRIAEVEYEDAPELTDDWFEEADQLEGERLVRPARRPGRPSQGKRPVSIRLSESVLAYYHASGPGWQTRLDADLVELVKSRS